MRASRFLHIMGIAAVLAGGIVLLVLHLWEAQNNRLDIQTELTKKPEQPQKMREHRNDGQALMSAEDSRFISSYYSAEPNATNLHAHFFDANSQRRIQHEHLLKLLKQERQVAAGGHLSRISDVVVPFLGIQENASQSSDFRSQGRSIDMSSGFIQKLFRLGHDKTWMDDLPVVGMRVEEDQLTEEYTVKGFKVGLPGKWLWLVHEPLQEGEEADATYIELRKAW